MGTPSSFVVVQTRMTVRFIQGYRYLDRCGEALIKLEEALDTDWIPTEASPTSGNLRNGTLGMDLTYNSQHFGCQQSEILLPDEFVDQSCKAFDILKHQFEIKRINAPSVQYVLNAGCEDGGVEDATRYLRALRLAEVRPAVLALIGGELAALDSVCVTNEIAERFGVRVSIRRRLAASVVQQQARVTSDPRLLQRVRLLPEKQREAIRALQRLQKMQIALPPVAVKVEIETAYEEEFDIRDFDLYQFLTESWTWGDNIRQRLHTLKVE